MKILSVFFAVTLLVSAVFGQPATLSYNVGDEWQFDYNTDVDTRGYTVTSKTRTEGAFTTINGTLLIQCQDQDAHSNLFAFNLFDNTFNVGEGIAQNYTDYEDGALGETMYYQQNFTGQITQIWYESDDDPVLVNIRLGLINAFHTHLTGYGNKFSDQETDPVAVHLTNIKGVQSTLPGVTLEVHKNFDQTDVITFSDPSVNKWNVAFLGATNTWIDSNGHIVGATLVHNVNLVDINQQQARKGSKNSKAPEDGSNVPMDSYLSSLGVMTINGASPVNNKESNSDRKLSQMSFAALKQSPKHIGGNMFDLASQLIAEKKNNFTTVNNMIRATAAVVFGSEEIAYGKQIKLIRHLNNAATKDVAILKNVLGPILMRFQGMIGQKGREHFYQVHSRLVNLLASISNAYAHGILVEHLKNGDAQMKLNVIYAMAHVRVPSEALVAAIFETAEHCDKKLVKTTALLHTGILVKKLVETKQASAGAFAERLLQFVERKIAAKDMHAVSTCVKALGNAGAGSFPHLRFSQVMSALFKTGDESIREQLVRFVGKKPMDIVSKAELQVQGSPMPFNESYTANVTIGGSILGMNIYGELFAGTNFDCNEPTFNYEALAEAQGILTFFGYTHSVFEAEAVYGKVNGVPEADELLLTVWGYVIYQESIPEVDCAEHYYPIAHEAPGIDVSYTLWIVIVPISFTATASVDLNLQWGWKICDTDLSVLVELIPTATPQVYGDAEIDLYIIKAGIELTGVFSVSIVPQAYIEGSECTVGFDIRQENPPMSVALTSYYEWQECFLFFFDCHWAQKNQYVWYSWSYPAQNIVLFQENWKIAGEQTPLLAAH